MMPPAAGCSRSSDWTVCHHGMQSAEAQQVVGGGAGRGQQVTAAHGATQLPLASVCSPVWSCIEHVRTSHSLRPKGSQMLLASSRAAAQKLRAAQNQLAALSLPV